jgi:hypothetical protein
MGRVKYDETEFYEDLHHLVQPIVGILRLKSQIDPKFTEERLALVLGLADLAFGEGRTHRVVDLDYLRDLRADHGCGYFRNEDEDVKPLIQDRYSKRKIL